MLKAAQTLIASAWLFIVASAATAQPSFECAQASSTVEEMICADSALATLDNRMSDRYAKAVDVARSLDTGAEEALQSLRATQRGWIKGRDECWKADDLRDCVKSAYLTREAELVALWILEEPSSVVSYSCGDNPAKEVTTFFFDTELPGIRLEYGDSIRSGWLVPAASGSKYATPFGGMFWTKGDNALFAWTEGDEISCKISG